MVGLRCSAFFNLAIFATLFSRTLLPVSFLFYLPPLINMMMFSMGGIAGIYDFFVRKYAELGFYETLSLTANLLSLSVLCWGDLGFYSPA